MHDTHTHAFVHIRNTQVRQRVDHKRTFLHLEQLILKHNAHAQALQIQVRYSVLCVWTSHVPRAQHAMSLLLLTLPPPFN